MLTTHRCFSHLSLFSSIRRIILLIHWSILYDDDEEEQEEEEDDDACLYQGHGVTPYIDPTVGGSKCVKHWFANQLW